MHLPFLQLAQILLDVHQVVLLLLLAISVATFATLIYSKYLKRIQQQQELRHNQELQFEKLSKRIAIKTQEAERKSIAKNLHDDIGNQLQMLLLVIHNMQDTHADDQLEKLYQNTSKIIESTRILAHRLYPANLEHFGLILTIEELMAQCAEVYTITLYMYHSYKKRSVTFEVQIYRIIQEFISNSIKHAAASHLEIHVRNSPKGLSFLLNDDGIGFDTTARAGMGLHNMLSRTKSIGGLGKIKSSHDKGTRLILLFSNEMKNGNTND
ncbi:histidine kinase [Sphingobacterium sp. lm-10]|uniref:sensor histidine kinase n=1 Tax=Sphingobacterium sp. lm-10 TaxID=2944904 RepID=UPI00202036BF|nr:ATP-binding protein [Sphingobacterium sp. lm-10]MCL7986620.1 histidine kinase [Sphingobacterium sp. lm-10]